MTYRKSSHSLVVRSDIWVKLLASYYLIEFDYQLLSMCVCVCVWALSCQNPFILWCTWLRRLFDKRPIKLQECWYVWAAQRKKGQNPFLLKNLLDVYYTKQNRYHTWSLHITTTFGQTTLKLLWTDIGKKPRADRCHNTSGFYWIFIILDWINNINVHLNEVCTPLMIYY